MKKMRTIHAGSSGTVVYGEEASQFPSNSIEVQSPDYDSCNLSNLSWSIWGMFDDSQTIRVNKNKTYLKKIKKKPLKQNQCKNRIKLVLCCMLASKVE